MAALPLSDLLWRQVLDVGRDRPHVTKGINDRTETVTPKLVRHLHRQSRAPVNRLLDDRVGGDAALLKDQVADAVDRVNSAMAQPGARAGLRRIGPHKLRHRYVSQRIVALNEDRGTVRHAPGHARAIMTLDTYSHLRADTGAAWPSSLRSKWSKKQSRRQSLGRFNGCSSRLRKWMRRVTLTIEREGVQEHFRWSGRLLVHDEHTRYRTRDHRCRFALVDSTCGFRAATHDCAGLNYHVDGAAVTDSC